MVGIIDNLLTGGLFDFAGKLLDKFIPDPQARQAAQLQLTQMQMQGELAQLTADTDLAKAQIAVNQVEAASASIFIAGPRPYILWVCGAELTVKVVVDFVGWVLQVCGYPGVIPPYEVTWIMGLMTVLLGAPIAIGRTIEKVNKAQATEPDH